MWTVLEGFAAWAAIQNYFSPPLNPLALLQITALPFLNG